MHRFAWFLAAAIATAAVGAEKTLIEWRFDKDGDLEGWTQSNHVADLRVEGGALCGRITNWDPFVRSPQFEIPASPWQRIDVRLKTDCGGEAEFFWTNTTKSKYGGFSPGKETRFGVYGDGRWHVYHVFPFWQKEGKIVLLRLDLPRPPEQDYGKRSFAVDWIRIVDLGEPASATSRRQWRFPEDASEFTPVGSARMVRRSDGIEVWTGGPPASGVQSKPMNLSVEDAGWWVTVEMKVDKGKRGLIRWASSGANGIQSRPFPLRADGRFHLYNIDMAASAGWRDNILLFELVPVVEPGAAAVVREVRIGREPGGRADVTVVYAGLEDALNRAGRRLKFVVYLYNYGGTPAAGLRLERLVLPKGVRIDETGDSWRRIPVVEPLDRVVWRCHVRADVPTEGPFRVELAGPGAPREAYEGRLQVLPALNLPKASYVPPPEPVETDYQIAAYYFPGWPSAVKWMPIYENAPERKPVLGWYDEANAECVDWQIKWAVENGIRIFMVDWYWVRGSRHLEHWVKAFEKARYRRFLKWCVMWANHNPPGTHSVADQRAVTKYWIEHCFSMPEYFRIDGRPVVIIWSPQNMERDMAGKGGAARLLAESQKVMKEAGLPEIWFVAMKWPEARVDRAQLRRLRDTGFSMTAIYHYMGHGGKAQDPKWYPFRLVVESSYPFWKEWYAADVLPFMPPISTGWDSRPWHGDRATVIYGRTVPLFRKICEDAKRFADETGIRLIALGPLNEWGEGSYMEPCKEFGFGLYEAVRDVFCKKSAGGWPLNYGPADVGLGPYDLPVEKIQNRTSWGFTDGPESWGGLMGVDKFEARNGRIRFVTTTGDPAVGWPAGRLLASRYPYAEIRMRISPAPPGVKDVAQLFWRTTSAPVSEGTSVRFDLVSDGKFHDYLIPLAESGRWHGRIVSFRFDPCSRAGAEVEIDRFRLLKEAPRTAGK